MNKPIRRVFRKLSAFDIAVDLLDLDRQLGEIDFTHRIGSRFGGKLEILNRRFMIIQPFFPIANTTFVESYPIFEEI